ncbi:hypothetical protein ACRKSW_05015 [Providencia sp. 2024EL-00811]|uniref:hypothetical protein n=1 Tax=Providencia sp. 2024EL-00811 TaxID=3411681 RepID=UPI003CA02700
MTDKQINFEAIGRCVRLQEKISQLIESRTKLYMEIRSAASSGMITYENATNTKSIDLDDIANPLALFKQINEINQSIINAAKAYNSWADKAGYEHYIISGGNNYNISVSVGLPVQTFNISGGQTFIETSVIKEAILKSITTKCATGVFLKAIAKTETEDQRRIKALETKLSSLESSMLSVQQTIADSEQALAASLEHIRSDIQSIKSGWL